MAELNQIWTDLLDKASIKAIENGRHDIADYLQLKLANDTVRQKGVNWLSQTFIDQGMEASLNNPGIFIDRISPHAFKIGMSNMVGSMIQVRHGVRCISLETGWARTPSDGIMRNGALAVAQLKHFGISAADAVYKLIRGELLPVWIDEQDVEVRTEEILRHFQIFLKN